MAPALGVRRLTGMPSVSERFAEIRDERSDLIGRVFRYGANAIVATVCSQVTFIVLYGWVGVGTTLTSTLAWLAGAIPNYVLNRSWTWGRRGRPSLRREVVPYVAIVLGTLGLAILATAARRGRPRPHVGLPRDADLAGLGASTSRCTS